MKKQVLGQSDLAITSIGLGAWAIGGSWEWGWGVQEDQDSIKTIHCALERGVNWIDTAPVYGLGHSEEVIGRALKQTSYQPYIFTKCGFRWNDKGHAIHNLTAESVREEVVDSLKRLDIECIDLYQIHWPNPEEQIEEAWEEMNKMVKEGKVRYLGVSNFSVEQMERVSTIAPITSLQPKYNAIAREVENDSLPYCSNNHIGVIAYSPMGSGLLTGKMTRERIQGLADDDWRKKSADFKEPKITKHLRVVETMSNIAKEKNCQTAEVAIAWALQNPAVTAAIVGMRTEKQVEGVICGGDIELTSEDMKKIEQVL